MIMNKICALLFFASILDAHNLVCMETNKRQPNTSHRFNERAQAEQINENFAQLLSKYDTQRVEVEHKIKTTRDVTSIQKLCTRHNGLKLGLYAIEKMQSNFNKAITGGATVSMAVAYISYDCDLLFDDSEEAAQETKNCLNVHVPLPGSSSK
jgi:glutathionylspermidine synthase